MSGAFSDAFSDAFDTGKGKAMLGIDLNYVPYGHNYHRICGKQVPLEDVHHPGFPGWPDSELEGNWLWEHVNHPDHDWGYIFQMTWEHIIFEKTPLNVLAGTTV